MKKKKDVEIINLVTKEKNPDKLKEWLKEKGHSVEAVDGLVLTTAEEEKKALFELHGIKTQG